MREYKGFNFKTKPWAHQLSALSYLYQRDCAALYTKPGSGKTKILIDLIVNRGFKRVLVVAPKKPCDVWPPQIRLHSDFDGDNIVPLHNLDWKGKQNELNLAMAHPKDEPLIFICNYESVWRKPLDKALFYKKLGIDCVICDESHKIKSPSSKCSRFLAKLGRTVQHRYLLTGTPLAENPMDVYAQYRFLDPSIFGVNYALFCAEYQNVDPILTSRCHYVVLNREKPYKNLETLREKMFSCAFYMDPSIKLPKTTRQVVELPMPKDLEKLYKSLLKEGAISFGDGFMTVNNALAMTTRKQQVTSGYLPIEYDDGSKELKRVSTYRRNGLLKLLEGFPNTEPIVVFARFTKDLVSVRAVAERLGTTYSELSGNEDSLAVWKAGKTQILGVQYNSGSEGIDLTRAHICVFYTLTHSLGSYDQARKRIHRPGQEEPCMYYHIVAKMPSGKTVDEEILSCLKEKKSYVTAVMRGEFEK